MTEETKTDCPVCAKRTAAEEAHRQAMQSRWIQNCIMVSECMNRLRLMPRLLVGLYGYMCWLTFVWFTGLDAPSAPQVTFASTIWGAAVGWFGFYVKSGASGSKKDDD